MLNRHEWEKIGRMPEGIDGPYLLVYQLNKSKSFVDYVEAVAKHMA